MARQVILGQEYKTKKAVFEIAKALRDDAPLDEPLSVVDATWITAVFRKYRNEFSAKVEAGITSVTVIYISGGRCFEFALRRGEPVQPSLKKAFEKASNSTKAKSIKEVFRSEVFNDVREARRRFFAGRAEAQCEDSGKTITQDTCEMDHFPVKFATIYQDFLAVFKVDTTTLKTVQNERLVHLLADRELANAWRNFHLQRASFRVLDREVHVEITRQDNKDGI